MRLLAFLILTATTFYFAGWTRSLPALILFGIQLGLLLPMFLLCLVLPRFIRLRFVSAQQETFSGESTPLRFVVNNRAPLPVSRFSTRLEYSYHDSYRTPEITKIRLVGGVSARREETIEFFLRPEHCGIVRVNLKGLRVSDYLALFTLPARRNDVMQLAVYPRIEPLRLLVTPHVGEGAGPDIRAPLRYGIISDFDVRQLREYSPGDPMRHIHWNRSAQSEAFWIKEFEHDNLPTCHLIIDRGTPTTAASAAKQGSGANPKAAAMNDRADLDPFYHLLMALLLALDKIFPLVRVHWYSAADEGFSDLLLADRSDIPALFRRLYIDDTAPLPADYAALLDNRRAVLPPDAMRIDPALNWSLGNYQVAAFTPENLRSRIASETFLLAAPQA